jgi:hypothetical protein
VTKPSLVLISNRHFGITIAKEFPVLSVKGREDFEDDESTPWKADPTLAEIFVPANNSRRHELGDLVLGDGFAAFSQRSTPQSFLDFPVVDVAFIKWDAPDFLRRDYPWADFGLIANTGEHPGAARYWVGYVPTTDAIRVLKKSGVAATRSDVFKAFKSGGLERIRFAVDDAIQTSWHVRWASPGSDFLLVSMEIWAYWQKVGMTGALDALALPDRTFLVHGSVRNVDMPEGVEECDN